MTPRLFRSPRPLFSSVLRMFRLVPFGAARRVGAICMCAALVSCARVFPSRQQSPVCARPADGCTTNTRVLLQIVSGFERYASVDLYHFETPHDMSGQNAFRATIARLNSFQETYPGVNEDIVGFVRGEAWMRLGDFVRAGQAFSLVADDPPSSLSAQAARKRDACSELETALSAKPEEKTPPASVVQMELDSFEERIRRLTELEKRWSGVYEGSLARREREKVEVEYVLFLFRNSCLVSDGKQRALDMGERMVREHGESRLIHAHRLRLGGFYLQLARDMVDLTPPDRTDRRLETGDRKEDATDGSTQNQAANRKPYFDAETFDHLISAAEEQFLLISRADGYDEKLEGAALLREAEAFRRKVEKMEQ
jgi:hypothetical protein